ncbi:MAG: hypothetical protein RLZZ543_1811, partial [Bacteroidota bacterium]
HESAKAVKEVMDVYDTMSKASD